MPDDLASSTFFDGRLYSFLNKVIFWREGSPLPNPLNAFEKELLQHGEAIRELNRALDGRLVSAVSAAQDFVVPRDSLIFLLTASRRGLLEEAKKALVRATDDRKSLDKKALQKLLKEAKEMPMSWAVGLHGDNNDERYEKNTPSGKSPGLDLRNLRDFK